MAVLLAALGLLGYRWVDEARSYDGLVAGAQSGYSGAILREHRNIPGPDALPVAAYTPGAEFAVWHVLSNLGGRSVRIEQLPGPAPFSYYGSVSVAVSRPHAADGRFDQGVRPFRPITLRPNEAVTVEYRLRMHDCKAKEEAGGTGAYQRGAGVLSSRPVHPLDHAQPFEAAGHRGRPTWGVPPIRRRHGADAVTVSSSTTAQSPGPRSVCLCVDSLIAHG